MSAHTWSDFWSKRVWHRRVAGLVAVALSLFHIYTGVFPPFEALIQRGIHLGLGLILVFLLFPRNKRGKNRNPNFLDWTIAGISILAVSYILSHFEWVAVDRCPMIDEMSWYEKVLGIMFILIVFEATRRVFNKALLIIVLVFLFYPFLGRFIPGFLYTGDISWTDLVDFNYLSTGGIFGIPLGVSSTEIAVFIIFGAIMIHSNGSYLFSNLAAGITGRMRGGPASVAVVGSALMGTITGAAAANVATTGSLTIPMMKKAGYPPEFAGAVEAAASTGGQVMPPVMGATAFVMAALSGIPYSTIIYYALLPAVLYFFCILVTVDLEARRLNIPLLKQEMNIRDTLKYYGHMFIPIAILFFLLIGGYTPRLAGTYGVLSALIICQLRPTTRLGFGGVLAALESGAVGMLVVVISTASAGFIVGSVDLTGLGNRLGTAFVDLAGGHLFVGLVLAMFVAILLGLGMPTTPAYIIQVATVIPGLIALGLPDYVAHMFAFYYSCLSVITPPVCPAAFTAAAIANADPWKTGWTAVRVAISAFIVPFLFVHNQSLLLVGSFSKVIIDMLTACLGAAGLGVAMVGFLLKPLHWCERVVVLIASLLLLFPEATHSLVGALLLFIFILFHARRTVFSGTLQKLLNLIPGKF
ncbi:MAG: TRAP transporter permease [Thermodesulfobacteriota bacterium]